MFLLQTISNVNCIENVVGINVFEYFTHKALNKERLTAALFKLCPLLCCQIISEEFGENRDSVTDGREITLH